MPKPLHLERKGHFLAETLADTARNAVVTMFYQGHKTGPPLCATNIRFRCALLNVICLHITLSPEIVLTNSTRAQFSLRITRGRLQ
jgi:hypothetical protein